jgi:hypothetical protein
VNTNAKPDSQPETNLLWGSLTSASVGMLVSRPTGCIRRMRRRGEKHSLNDEQMAPNPHSLLYSLPHSLLYSTPCPRTFQIQYPQVRQLRKCEHYGVM